ncbi:hypothetical protein FB45DRAFT_216493 [Roridomyces roridus]|uniref:BTB domain-containing protein n=1 Tax=Roridomyces roridus TaxID=1738132 RepID=A0AAD7FG30_9AGAR|nr:hypothetical protein FB45DRAFT_216493 [Roridomyces roridus]
MSTTASSPRDAPAPFSGVPDDRNDNRLPDFILRSADLVDFHVHKEILKFASEYFDSMFAFPAGFSSEGDLSRGGLQVLVLPEPSSVWLRLLSLAYPATSADQYTLTAPDLDGFWQVFQAAHKYQFIVVQTLLGTMLDNPLLLRTHPHRIFALARLCDLPHLVTKAALATLAYPLSPGPEEFPEMFLISWATVAKLQSFHHACARNARRIAEYNAGVLDLPCPLREGSKTLLARHTRDESTHLEFVWRVQAGHGMHCGPRADGRRRASPQRACVREWFKSHTARVAERLLLVPAGTTVTAVFTSVPPAECAVIDACAVCARNADRDLETFAAQLKRHVDKANDEIAQATFAEE